MPPLRCLARALRSRAAALILLLTGVAAPLAAQGTGTVEGTVTAGPGGAPLADATVFVLGLRRGAATDVAGHFRIAGLPAGRAALVAQRVGFAADTVAVDVPDGGTASITIALREAAAVIAPVTVSATRELQRRSEGSVTIDAVSAAEIRQTRAAHPAEIMNRVAGVHVMQTSGEGHQMAIRLPISTSPMYLYLEDGIPTRATGFFNHNALYEVNLPQAGGIEVIKGPGTALYGSDAIGGIVNVLTRPAPVTPTVDLSVEGGAYGYRRLLATGGGTWGNNGVRADVNVTHSDNWKDAAPFDRQSGTLRWDAAMGASGWTARTVLTGSRIDQQDVPAVSAALFDTATTTNLAPIAYRRVRALRLSTAIEKDGGLSLFSFTPYGRLDDMGLLPSWQLTYDPQTYDTRNASAGFLARWRRDLPSLRARVIVGADGDWSPGRFVARRAIVVRSGPANAWTSYTDGETQYDYDVTYRAVSPYLQTEWTLLPRLRVDAGVRADVSGYAYTTHLTPVDTGSHRVPPSTTVRYTHVSPKIGATYELSPAANVYASYRNGFRAPSQNQLFVQSSAVNTVGLEPVTVDSWETGVRGQLGARVVYQLDAYDMTIDNDILTYVTPQNSREARNAGSTRHRGIEASTGLALASTVRVDLAYSVATHRYVDWTPQAATATKPAVSYSGNTVEQAPRDLADVLVAWTPRALRGGRVALEWSHTGRYAEDPANTAYYGGYELVNLSASAVLAARTELFARVINLADRRYAELVTYDAFRKDQYTPGAPRSLFVGMRHAF